MKKANRGAVAEEPNRRSGRLLAKWLRENAELLAGLRALRRLADPAADAAVDAILALSDVARLRLSWQLWEALASGEGIDAEELLNEYTSPEAIDAAREALWGPRGAPSPPPRLRLVDTPSP